MYEAAKDDPNRFAEVLTADNTGVFDPISLAIEKSEMLREYGEDDGTRRFDQEYFCSFTAGMPGSYYAKLMDDAEKDGRICRVPHEPRLPVHTAWDLGMGDSTAIIFFQLVGLECRVIHYYENSGVGVDHYVQHLDKLGYKYGEHVLPHDAEVRELGTGRSRLEVLESLGLRYPRIVPAQRIVFSAASRLDSRTIRTAPAIAHTTSKMPTSHQIHIIPCIISGMMTPFDSILDNQTIPLRSTAFSGLLAAR
jgi:hypothetical protein